MSLYSPHHEKCPMRIGGDWCNCFTLRGHDADLDRMTLDRLKHEAIQKDAARRCAEMVKRGADIQRQHAENTKRENRWTEKEMSVSESGVEAYLTAANALDFWEYQIRREFGLLDAADSGAPNHGKSEDR